jgi:hypothetical protein
LVGELAGMGGRGTILKGPGIVVIRLYTQGKPVKKPKVGSISRTYMATVFKKYSREKEKRN